MAAAAGPERGARSAAAHYEHQVVNVQLDVDADLETVAATPWEWPLRVGQLFRLELEFTGYEMAVAPPPGAVAIQGQVEDDFVSPPEPKVDRSITRPRWEP